MPMTSTAMISALSPGLARKARLDLLVQQEDDQPAEHHEDQHPEQEDAG